MEKKKTRLYDTTKIVAGLAIFIGVVALPVVYNLALGKPGERPKLQRAADSQPAGSELQKVLATRKDCIMSSAKDMRGEHMDLLNIWRDEYVREGKLVHKGKFSTWPDGKPVLKSLSKTCLGCHADRTKFCDKCHAYAGVKPYCWDCHVLPKGRN